MSLPYVVSLTPDEADRFGVADRTICVIELETAAGPQKVLAQVRVEHRDSKEGAA